MFCPRNIILGIQKGCLPLKCQKADDKIDACKILKKILWAIYQIGNLKTRGQTV